LSAFANGTFADASDDALDSVARVLRCDRPAQYDGTRVFNPFCLQLPERLLSWPRWHEFMPRQVPHDPSIVAAQCENAWSPREGFWPFDLPRDNCRANDGLPRPQCPACDHCERRYDVARAGFGGTLDVLLMTVNLLELLLDDALAADLEGAPEFEDRAHFAINAALLALATAVLSAIVGLPGLLTPVPVVVYLIANGQISIALLSLVLYAWTLLRAGLVAALLAITLLVGAWLALAFLGIGSPLRLGAVCAIARALRALSGLRAFRRFWLPALAPLIDTAELSCYGAPYDAVIPLAHLELYALNSARLTFVLIAALLAYQLLFDFALALAARAFATLLALLSAAFGVYQGVRLILLRRRVARLADDVAAIGPEPSRAGGGNGRGFARPERVAEAGDGVRRRRPRLAPT